MQLPCHIFHNSLTYGGRPRKKGPGSFSTGISNSIRCARPCVPTSANTGGRASRETPLGKNQIGYPTLLPAKDEKRRLAPCCGVFGGRSTETTLQRRRLGCQAQRSCPSSRFRRLS